MRLLLLGDAVVVVLEVALAGRIKPCRGAAVQLGRRDFRRSRYVQHEKLVHIGDTGEAILQVGGIVSITDGERREVVERLILRVQRLIDILPAAVAHRGHLRVEILDLTDEHICPLHQPRYIGAGVVPLGQLADHTLQHRDAPVLLGDPLKLRHIGAGKAQNAGVVHPDPVSDAGLPGQVVILGQAKVRRADIFHQLHRRKDADVPVKDADTLVPTQAHPRQVKRLGQCLRCVLALQHDEPCCAAVQAAPLEPLEQL